MESYYIAYAAAAALGALPCVLIFKGALWKRVSIGAATGMLLLAAVD